MRDVEDMIRKVNLSVTAQRLAVMKVVDENPHCTADFLITAVGERIGKISKQAIYDILHMFTEKDLIRRIQPSHSPALFETRVGDNHHHLICRQCMKTYDVDCAVGHAPCLTPSDDHGFEIDEAEVIYWGICPECKKSNQKL